MRRLLLCATFVVLFPTAVGAQTPLSERPAPAEVIRLAKERRKELAEDQAYETKFNATMHWIVVQQPRWWRNPHALLKTEAYRDGSWSFHVSDQEAFDHCSNVGSDRCRIRATAMSLLALMSHGHTHQRGKYQPEFQWGLDYLLSEAKVSGQTIDLRGPRGNLWSQALATLAIAEAYGMTRDNGCQVIASGAVAFLVSQQSATGGWSMEPDQESDVEATAWCAMALRSAVWAKVDVPAEAFQKTATFLGRLRSTDGPGYGRTSPGKDPLATAMGVVAWQMSSAANRDVTHERACCEMLIAQGPAKHDATFNFFGQLAVSHLDDPKAWEKWNSSNNGTRYHLLQTCVANGHERGSWFDPEDTRAASGGRLYQTTISALTKAVYYRHLGIFAKL